MPPCLGRYTVDTHHNPGYAAGYLYNKVKPRLAMSTHMPNDFYLNGETVAEVRTYWNGPYHFGFDGTVVNMTKVKIWVREGILPKYPNQTPPQAYESIEQYGGLIVPKPRKTREEMQEPTIREAQYDPNIYYPDANKPVLMEEWPTEKDLFIPLEQVPPGMLRRGEPKKVGGK